MIWTLILALGIAPFAARADTPPIPDIRAIRIADGFDQPVHVASARDGSGHLYVVEQAGRILRMDADGRNRDVFLDIRSRVESGGEKGLLSVAFHPRFSENRRYFVNYTTRSDGQLFTRVSEFTSGERIVLTFRQPYANHNGGHILFGPDGYLYIGNGDGGSANDPQNHAQQLNTWLGKILRVDVDRREADRAYGIPADNPFVGRADAKPEIYAYGLRNPWRMCFDSETGRMWAGDVGQWRWEEVDLIEKGGNYGWRVLEGRHCNHTTDPDCDPSPFIPPVAEYGREQGLSITGGNVYRGRRHPSLDGLYFFADYGSGRVWALRQDGARTTGPRQVFQADRAWTSFGEDEDGELLLVSHQGGIYRIAPR